MRVGYVTYGLDRAPTGIGRYAIELLRALAALPNAPEIVLLTTEREDRHGLWQRFERHALPGCYLLPALLSVGNLALSRAIRRYDLDILHDPNGIAPFLGPKHGAKRLVTIHDAFAFVHPETHNRLDNWRYRMLLPWASRRADTVMTDSAHSRRDLEQHLKIEAARINVIPCGLDPHFTPVADCAARQHILDRYRIVAPYLLYVGGINARKNIARLFEAFAQVRADHPSVKLVIGGKRQWQTREIEATFERLALHDSVHFTGYVQDADLPSLYSAAEAFVFPSLYEGFGMPPLEAMACGAPVITSNVSSLPEVVGDAALTVDPYNIAELAGALRRVLADRELRSRLQQQGFVRARQFSWNRTARATYDLYATLLNQTLPSRVAPDNSESYC